MSFTLQINDINGSRVSVDGIDAVPSSDGAACAFRLEDGDHVLVLAGASDPGLRVQRPFKVNGQGSETVSARSFFPRVAPAGDPPAPAAEEAAPAPVAADVFDVTTAGVRRGVLSPHARSQVLSIFLDPRDASRIYSEFDVIEPSRLNAQAAAWAQQQARQFMVVYAPELGGFVVRALTSQEVQLLRAVWEPAVRDHTVRNVVVGGVILAALLAIGGGAAWYWLRDEDGEGDGEGEGGDAGDGEGDDDDGEGEGDDDDGEGDDDDDGEGEGDDDDDGDDEDDEDDEDEDED